MKYAYINGKILNGKSDMMPETGKIVLTDGDRITAIADDGIDISGYKVVDLDGKYLMPGLINMHVHLPAAGSKPKKHPTDSARLAAIMTSCAPTRLIMEDMCQSYARTELMSGVTTIRTVGGIRNYDSKIRDKIKKGIIDGPRILSSNYAISVPHGHMAGSVSVIAHNADEAVNYVREIAEGKPDLIKLMITGGVMDATVKGEPGVLKMPPEMVRAACEEAHRLGYKVAAHVESPEGVRVALENGVDSIEHGARPDEEIIELFKQRGAFHILTISPALPYALFDRSVSNTSEMGQFNGNVVFEGMIECAKACLENGIPVGLGTDTGCPFTTHYNMWRELDFFRKYCGVTSRFALHTATQINAELAGLGEITGTIEAGKCADMIVTEADPLDDLQALRNIEMVSARGKLFVHPHVRKMENVDRELDKYL
ncbi:MAG: amidohydrolase family protein [Eubacteriaceae bacterium]|jgi:imidazolonepropionase-like amidohydrolase